MGKYVPIALTIAGSDSGGGAGVEADLKTFATLGVYGVVAITSVTAQNTYEIRAIHDIPPDIVRKQIEAVVDDMGVDAAKTGMLSNSEIIKVVTDVVKRYSFPLVVDPVLRAKSGVELLRPTAIDDLRKYLIPLATVVTPNINEAERLTSIDIRGVDDMKEAAKYLVDVLGAKAAVIKGGHLGGDYAIDVIYYDGVFKEVKTPKISGCTHGTGCVFSAAITAELAKGEGVIRAIIKAKEFVTKAIEWGVKLGKGYCPVNPIAWLEIPAQKYKVLEDLRKAIELLESNSDLVLNYVPEVQMNLVMALPKKYAKDLKDVAGVLGRIVRYGDRIKAVGPPTFGASRHLAKAVLKLMEYHPEVRAAVNIRYSEEVIEVAKRLGYKVSFYDRREEPEEVKRVEGATIPWGIEVALRRINYEAPDIIYHLGDWGKEPMINVFGRDALEAVSKLLRMLKELKK